MSRRRRSSNGGPSWGLWALGGATVVALGWYLLRDDPEAAPESAGELVVGGGGGGLVVSTPAPAPAPAPADAAPAPVVDVPRNPPGETTTTDWRDRLNPLIRPSWWPE